MPQYLTTELEAIVARGYNLPTVRVPATLGVCTDCCMDPDLERRILSTPVEDITDFMLREFYEAAFGDDPAQPVMLWLLPRVLDGLAQDLEVSNLGNEVALQRCERTVALADWPEPQRRLLSEFAAAYIDARLDAKHPELDATFCMFALSGMDLSPMLDRLDHAAPPRLARAIVTEWEYGPPRLGQDAFWEAGPALDQVRTWFARPELADRLLAWGVEHDGTTADLALQAADMLHAGRNPWTR